jgi:hypothetical protein
MRSSLLDNLPEALAGVRTRPLFVMRLSSRMQVIGPTPGYVRRVGGVFEGQRLTGEVLDSGNGRPSAATAPSPWTSAWSSKPTTKP